MSVCFSAVHVGCAWLYHGRGEEEVGEGEVSARMTIGKLKRKIYEEPLKWNFCFANVSFKKVQKSLHFILCC